MREQYTLIDLKLLELVQASTILANKHLTMNRPPTPAYIFRGHEAAIHALHFFHANHFFASGDVNGWIVIWRLTTKRPVAVWKAHDAAVSGIKDWRGDRLITHGRDHKLRVWQVREDDLEGMSVTLPIDGASKDNRQPWLVHSMDVNALNFCAFAICPDPNQDSLQEGDHQPLLLASPNGLDNGGIDIFQLPSEQRVSKIQSDKKANTGMVMSLRILTVKCTGRLTIVVGYEDGQVAVYAKKEQNVMPAWIWERLFISRPHHQPVLSLDVDLEQKFFITSSADAAVARFSLPGQRVEQLDAEKTNNTKHAGQQDLKIRSDGRIFATAGWDKHVRVYSTKSLKELAVLQWHKEGCYALDFASIALSSELRNGTDDSLVASNAMAKVKQERENKIHSTHWLVSGSKDGKIALWDVY